MLNLNFLKVNLFSPKKYLLLAALVILIGAGGYFAYDYYQTQKELENFQSDTDLLAIKEKNDLLKKLSNIAELPNNEEPTIATVADAFRLRGQKFFEQAKNGDKVIIYKEAQRAILYRPETGKIVESAPVNIQDLENTVSRKESSQTSQSTPGNNLTLQNSQMQVTPSEEPARLAIYNGTLYVDGLANSVGAFLVKELPGNQISVDLLENANKINENTLIFDLTKKHSQIAGKIADLLGGKLEEAPSDVNYPDVDIIIIAGKDLENKNLQ
jgi:hypothetical protein